jgi:hypothetical protein
MELFICIWTCYTGGEHKCSVQRAAAHDQETELNPKRRGDLRKSNVHVDENWTV